MARGRQTRRIPDWMIGLIITLGVLGVAWVRPACLEAIEYERFDARLTWYGVGAPARNTTTVACHMEFITKLGRPPLPGSWIAALVDRLGASRPSAQRLTGSEAQSAYGIHGGRQDGRGA